MDKIQRAKRILAVSTGGLGDTILFSPAIKALRCKYPDAYIELLLASRIAADAYAPAKEIDRIVRVRLNRSAMPLKIFKLFAYIIRTRIRGAFDLGVFATGLNPKLAVFLKATGVIKSSSCAPLPPKCATDFACNLSLASGYDSTIDEQGAFIPVTGQALKKVARLLSEIGLNGDQNALVAIYPSIDLSKRPRWALSNLVQVVHKLKADLPSLRFIVLGSQTEREDWQAIDTRKVVDANLAGRLNISDSAALMSMCAVAICNDGGLMHVAGAVGCPLVAIMPWTPITYAPPGDSAIVVKYGYREIFDHGRPQLLQVRRKRPDNISSDDVCDAVLHLIEKLGLVCKFE